MIVQLLSSFKLHPDDAIYIGLQSTVDAEYEVLATIKAQLPNLPLHPVLLDRPTRGAAHTLNLIISKMNPEHLKKKTISLDCDTLYFYDVLAEMRKLGKGIGCVYCFEDEGEKPIYSYTSFDESTNGIEKVTEKVRISSHANTGAYGFSNALILSQYLEKLLVRCLPEKGEFYTSAVISEMIADGLEFQAVQVRLSDFACVGTPGQLRDFVNAGIRRMELTKQCVVVFDLETLGRLQGSQKTTEQQILDVLPAKFVLFMRRIAKDGFEVRLSFENGYCPDCKNSIFNGTGRTQITYATEAVRQKAKLQGYLFPVNEDFNNVVGW